MVFHEIEKLIDDLQILVNTLESNLSNLCRGVMSNLDETPKMHIHEATKKALASSNWMARASDSHCWYYPSKTFDWIAIQGEGQEPALYWSPTKDDLMADDWYVIRR